MKPISRIAAQLGLRSADIEPYGRDRAKVALHALRASTKLRGALIAVTSITPTPAGEGKTCTAIGLTQALGRLRKRVAVCLREPSLGPLLGIKGGATGSAKSRLLPPDEINLHFTGDIHAIGTAHNFLAAVIDNHIVKGNRLELDQAGGSMRRAIDIPDRQLRHIVTGLGGRTNGIPRESGFDITAASELMGVVALAKDLADLKRRMGRMIVGYTRRGDPITAKQLDAVGAMAVILKDAIRPNLVQTLEGQPALVHTGPFANVSHGNSSVIATRLALQRSEYVVTESGFGADLGFEKLCDIVCPQAGLVPSVAVVVVSVRALKLHGGQRLGQLHRANLGALERGCANLLRHLQIVKRFGVPVVVAINRFPTDSVGELRLLRRVCQQQCVPAAVSQVVRRGGVGGIELAKLVIETARTSPGRYRRLYPANLSLTQKLQRIACELYGASGVRYDRWAEEEIHRLTRLGYGRLPVNVAKTQLSFTDDPAVKGAPDGWRLRVRDVRVAAGAGYVIALCGKMTFMPGLPKRPLAEAFDVANNGQIIGLA